MEIRQKLELRRLLVPQLQQSLNILALPLLDLKASIEAELENNPLLEEAPPLPPALKKPRKTAGLSLQSDLVPQKVSLQDVLIRQLGMFANHDDEFFIGQKIIEDIDENGYLKANLEEIARNSGVSLDKAENALQLIQQFEPLGVAGRTIAECLLIQLKFTAESDPLLEKIITNHLEDVAKKNYSHIAKSLNETREKVEILIKKILKLDPKPGRNYSTDEIHRVIPDILVYEKYEDDSLEIEINNEDIPALHINKAYKDMLKDNNLDPATKAFLSEKFHNALEMLRAVTKRTMTLRKIVESITETQQDAIRNDLSYLKPLTFKDIAQKINLHESTISRAVMNKYIELPWGIIPLKKFFTSHVQDGNGQSVSSARIKSLIKERVDGEEKKHPLSDQDISNILFKENNLVASRRTVTKYREELKILSSTFRKER